MFNAIGAQIHNIINAASTARQVPTHPISWHTTTPHTPRPARSKPVPFNRHGRGNNNSNGERGTRRPNSDINTEQPVRSTRVRVDNVSDINAPPHKQRPYEKSDTELKEELHRATTTFVNKYVPQHVHFLKQYSLPNTTPDWEQKELQDMQDFNAALRTGGTFYICNSCGTRRLLDQFHPNVLTTESPMLGLLCTDVNGVPVLVGDYTNGVRLCLSCHSQLRRKKLPAFAIANNMKFGDMPQVLTCLTPYELRLIAQVDPFISIHRLPAGGQSATKGNVINFYNDIPQVLKRLPRSVDNVHTVFVRLEGSSSQQRPIRPAFLRAALVWLKANNPLYADVVIDEAELDRLGAAQPNELVIPRDTEDDNTNTNTESTVPSPQPEDLLEDLSSEADIETLMWDSDDLTAQQRTENILPQVLPRPRNNQYVDVPRHNSSISERDYPNIAALAFPLLFPYGTGLFVEPTRRRRIKYESEYYRHLITYYDRRFVACKKFLFFAFHRLQRSRAAGAVFACANFAQRQGDTAAPIQLGLLRQVSETLENNSHTPGDAALSEQIKRLTDKLRPFFTSVPGSVFYFNRKKKELNAMLRDGGKLPVTVPTWFVTFSPADSYWPELAKAELPHYTDQQIYALRNSHYHSILQEYAESAAQLFWHRWNTFWDHIIHGRSKPLGNIIDFFIRVEFQARGSPHLHILLWMLEAAKASGMLDDDVGREQLAVMIDKFVHTWTIDVPADADPKVSHASKEKSPEEVLSSPASQLSLGRDISYSQLHGPICTNSCYKYCKPGEPKVCRFGFPKATRDVTEVKITRNSARHEMQILTKRNHVWVNNYNPTALRCWKANMDIQFCANPYGTAVYMCNYATKTESDTILFRREFRNRLLRQSEETTTLYRQLYALAMSCNKAREVSQQEAVWLILGYPLVQFSRDIINVQVSPKSTRNRVLPQQTAAEEMADTVTDWEPKSPKSAKGLKMIYAGRPDTPEWDNTSLYTFLSDWAWVPNPVEGEECITLQGDLGAMKKRKRAAIINPVPHIKTDFDNEDYCNAVLILHIPWRQEEEWRTQYPSAKEALTVKRASMPQDLLEELERVRNIELAQQQIREDGRNGIPPVPRHETIPHPESIDAYEQAMADNTDQPDTEPEMQYVYNNGVFRSTRNWSAADIVRARSFVKDQKAAYELQQQVGNDAMEFLGIPQLQQQQEQLKLQEMVDKLNKEQRFAYDIVVWHLLRDEMPDRQPLRLFVSGPGGTGKSFLIDTIACFARLHFGKTGGKFGPVVLMAPTGAAATNIKGSTVHHAMSIMVGGRTTQTNAGDTMQKNHRGSKIFIFDEVSMIDGVLLKKVESNMRYINPDRKDQAYGGHHVIFLGDFYQLSPIPTPRLYKLIDPLDKELWIRPNDAVVFLTQQMRHHNTNGVSYGDVNLRARTATVSEADLALLNSRVVRNPDNSVCGTVMEFADRLPYNTPMATYTNNEVKEVNQHKLKATGHPVVNCWARHHYRSKNARRVNQASLLDNDSLVLEPLINISLGAPVMLLKNIATELGLVNGSIGTVYDIIYDSSGMDGLVNPHATKEEAINSTPMLALPIVLVQFPTYRGASFVLETPNVVPIVPGQESNGKSGDDSWTRVQLPLRTAYAMTIHKTQGMTLERLGLDLTRANGKRGLAYVGLSRIKTLEGLFLREPLTLRNFTAAHSDYPETTLHADYVHIDLEYTRLFDIQRQTIVKYRDLFSNVMVL